jgi:hypothetical protein
MRLLDVDFYGFTATGSRSKILLCLKLSDWNEAMPRITLAKQGDRIGRIFASLGEFSHNWANFRIIGRLFCLFGRFFAKLGDFLPNWAIFCLIGRFFA